MPLVMPYSGNYHVVNDDVAHSTAAILVERDNMEKPWAEFIWRCLSKGELEARLEIRRSTNPPIFKILPDPSIFEPADLETPVTTRNSTKGLKLATIDHFAFLDLDQGQVTDIDRAMSLAKAFIDDQQDVDWSTSSIGRQQDVKRMPFQQVRESASLQLQKSIIHEDIRIRTLCVLGCLDEEDPEGYAKAAMKAMREGKFDAPDGESLAKDEILRTQRAKSQIEETSTKGLRALCQKQSSLSDFEVSRLAFSDVQMFAEKRILELPYLRAKVQVVRLLAEEKISKLTAVEAAELQDNPVKIEPAAERTAEGGAVAAANTKNRVSGSASLANPAANTKNRVSGSASLANPAENPKKRLLEAGDAETHSAKRAAPDGDRKEGSKKV